ncbi:MAG: hypothetical protein ACXWQZ_01330 [Ktedonobacterales bacterium]
MEKITEEAADKAVHQVFLMFGVDTRDRDEVVALTDDLRHVRRWRLAQDQVKGASLKAAATFLVTGILASVWIGVRIKLGLPPVP